jgi:HK97 family phage portal protein
MLWGNGYAEIERDALGRAVALWPITPDRVTPKRDVELGLYYEINIGRGTPAHFASDDILHIHVLGWDGAVGYDVFSYMSDVFGRAAATDEHATSFFKNGALPSGILKSPNKLTKVAIDEIKQSMADSHGSVKNFFKNMVLTEGLEWLQVQIDPEKAQLLESRKFTVNDIARVFRIPPHMLGDLEKATYTNIEQQSTEFATYTIMPWATRWEEEINRKLLNGPQYCKMNMTVFLRGDQETRYKIYTAGRNIGMLSANDCREMEDLDPIPGIAGSSYIVPINFQLADNLDKQPIADPATKPAPDDEGASDKPNQKDVKKPVTNFAPLVENLIERATNRIYNALEAKYKNKNQYWPEESEAIYNKFSPWLNEQLTVLESAGFAVIKNKLADVNYSEEPNREKINKAIKSLFEEEKNV